MNIDGEPGAYRKVHAGFGEGHPETPALAGWSAPDAHSPILAIEAMRATKPLALASAGFRWSSREVMALHLPHDQQRLFRRCAL